MRKLVMAITLASLLAGCAMGHRDPIEAKGAINQAINDNGRRDIDTLPASVEADLMPELNNHDENKLSTMVKRFRIKANGVSAKAFFTSLVKGTPYSAAIHPDVSGKITVNLNDVSLDEVLTVVQDMYGYDITKTGNVLQVYPAGLRTVTIPVDYLQFKRTGRSLTSISTGSITNGGGGASSNTDSSDSGPDSSSDSSSNGIQGGTEIETSNESDFWPQLENAVTQLIGSEDGQSVVVTPQASVITLRAYPDEIREVRRFLGISQQRMHRQVVLEAKILEVTLNDGYQQGIDWSKAFSSNGTNFALGQGSIVKNTAGDIIPAVPATLAGLDPIGTLLGGQSNLVISSGSFGAVLSFMATQGDLNVLSSPRVTASNNQKAIIKVGTDNYFVTGISSNTDTNNSSSNTSNNVEITPFFSGISLDVTPQIDDQGNVLLHVHPAVIDVKEVRKEINLGNNVIALPLASSAIRESDSVIRAQDGDVVVIGGLMKSSHADQVAKVPLLGDIPLLGHLFRKKTQLVQKTELVILLKPSVVGVNTWQKELERSRDLLQEWFPDEL